MEPRSFSNRPGARFWAWTVSIGLHFAVLTAFAVLKFPGAQTQDRQHSVPIARVRHLTQSPQKAAVLPKPKIKIPANSAHTENKKIILAANQNFQIARPDLPDQRDIDTQSDIDNFDSITQADISCQPIEFFGTSTKQRKVCFVVDCSGSMKGMFGLVQKNLIEFVSQLRQDQYFYIIFFGNGKIVESGSGRLIRATETAKKAAYEFIYSISPAGKTNALGALQKAVQIRDSIGQGPSVVYFLTDGFELTSQSKKQFTEELSMLLEKFAPTSKINTIGFWPQAADRDILSTIAWQSGGQATFITAEKLEENGPHFPGRN
jgi:Mg-chelatase subunit ChlD